MILWLTGVNATSKSGSSGPDFRISTTSQLAPFIHHLNSFLLPALNHHGANSLLPTQKAPWQRPRNWRLRIPRPPHRQPPPILIHQQNIRPRRTHNTQSTPRFRRRSIFRWRYYLTVFNFTHFRGSQARCSDPYRIAEFGWSFERAVL